MTKVTVWNSLNAKTRKKKRYEVPGKSETVPDHHMPMREILIRFAQGRPIPNGAEPKWDSDENAIGIDIRSLDLAEIQEMQYRGEIAKSEYEQAREYKEQRQLDLEKEAEKIRQAEESERVSRLDDEAKKTDQKK